MKNKRFSSKNLIKARERAAAANRKLKETETEAANYYNSIVADAMKTAVKKGLMPRKYFDDILDKCVTKKAHREFMNLSPLEADKAIQSNGNGEVTPHQQESHQEQAQQYQHN